MTTYFKDRYQGVGAIAAEAPAPRSAPAPSVGAFSREMRRADPMLALPRVARRGRVGHPLPGVITRRVGEVRPPVLLSGVRPGRAPRRAIASLSELGLDGPGMTTSPRRLTDLSRRLQSRLAASSLKPAAYVPPTAPLVQIQPIVATVSSTMPARGITPLTGRAPATSTTGPGMLTYPKEPRIGTGIGQAPGPVVAIPPSPYGAGITAPTATVGSGVAIEPVLETFEPMPDWDPPPSGMTSVPVPSGGGVTVKPWMLLGGGALLLFFLTRRKR